MRKEEYYQINKLEEHSWWFKGKRDLLEKLLKAKSNCKILDVGCGSGGNLKVLEKYGNVYGIDMSIDALNLCKQKNIKNLILCNAKEIPFKENSFDFVICLDTIEHINSDFKVVDEINRILKKDGELILSVPAFKFLWSDTDEVVGHKRRYNKKQLKNLLNKFHTRITYWNFFLFIPTILLVYLQKIIPRKEKKNILARIPKFVDNFLLFPLKIENYLIKKGVNFPFGVTLLAVARKK